MQWNTSKDAVPAGHVQITVYDESTGKRVATVFESEAHARLIKAAPQLLEDSQLSLGFLKGLYEYLPADRHYLLDGEINRKQGVVKLALTGE